MGQDGGNTITPEDPTKPAKKPAKQRKVWMLTGIGLSLFALVATIAAIPTIIHSSGDPGTPKSGLAINKNFPDPGFVHFNRTWYAFATNSIVNDLGEVFRVPVAVSSDFKHWNTTSGDALPTLADWETPKDHWAPDVVRRVSNSILIVSFDRFDLFLMLRPG